MPENGNTVTSPSVPKESCELKTNLKIRTKHDVPPDVPPVVISAFRRPVSRNCVSARVILITSKNRMVDFLNL